MNFLIDPRIRIDTRYVLKGDYRAATLAQGIPALNTPIFDRLAAGVFGRDESLPSRSTYAVVTSI